MLYASWMSSSLKYDHECFDNNASFLMRIVICWLYSQQKINKSKDFKNTAYNTVLPVLYLLCTWWSMSKLSAGYKYRKSTSIRHFEQCNQ